MAEDFVTNNDNQQTPYAALEPVLILEALESLGLTCSGSLLALNSYENRVYQVGLDDAAPLIAKFYRPNRWSDAAILEEHAFSSELFEHELPIITPMVIDNQTLHYYKGFRFALFPRQGGRPLELDNLDQLEWMGRFLGRLHAISSIKPFEHRMQLNIDTYGREPYQYLLEHHFIPDYLKTNFCRIIEILLEKISLCMQSLNTITYIRVHGDCHAGNVLWTDRGPHIIDLDDALMAPAIQDIWMLLSGNQAQVKQELDIILNGYCEFHDINLRELHLIEVLRSLRIIQYTGWLAKRWQDPTFPLNFPWFNTANYWQKLLQDLSEQSDILDNVLDNNGVM